MLHARFGAGLRPRCVPAGLLALAIALNCGSSADAGIIDITENAPHRLNSFGAFTGTIEYTSSNDDGTGVLLVTIANTLPDESRGYITGFVFNINSIDPFAKATLLEAPEPFKDASHQHAQPFGGDFDAGAALKGHFMGGGNPHKGIAPGETASFRFLVTAADARQLTPEKFLEGPYDHNFIVRFRAAVGSGNDLAPAISQTIPGPSALVALALLAAISPWRSVRRRASPSSTH